MLSPYRVLDLSNERGMLAGQMLADLGAGVIQIEPPGGSSARDEPPFANDEPGADRSLFWWAYARNKRGITCDIQTAEGQDLIKQLAATADFLLESGAPGEMAGLGLGYEDLAQVNERLIYASITPWGQDGPRSAWAASDLILMAAGGPLFIAGFPDGAPVRVSVPQAYHHAAADAASAAMIAHMERQRSGRGQYIDVAAVQSAAAATQSGILANPIGEAQPVRAAGGAMMGTLRARIIWPASDGYVSFTFLFGTAVGPFTLRMMEWIHEEGMCSEADRDLDWVGFPGLLASGEVTPDEYERIIGVVEAFLATKTKAELFEEAQRRKLLLVPITNIEDVATSPQLQARGYWQETERPDGQGTVRLPGPFVQFRDNPIQYRRRAPRLGEHNAEVYAELGVDSAALADLQAKGAI
ncbi:MAG TPA: CaiB/BaiF CoA-transferase family protein [Dehalococcoidia bacterium]|nr:CaiB/BaiF CoA-transferase family protein [Dehalococcoidia bacterium]